MKYGFYSQKAAEIHGGARYYNAERTTILEVTTVQDGNPELNTEFYKWDDTVPVGPLGAYVDNFEPYDPDAAAKKRMFKEYEKGQRRSYYIQYY